MKITTVKTRTRKRSAERVAVVGTRDDKRGGILHCSDPAVEELFAKSVPAELMRAWSIKYLMACNLRPEQGTREEALWKMVSDGMESEHVEIFIAGYDDRARRRIIPYDEVRDAEELAAAMSMFTGILHACWFTAVMWAGRSIPSIDDDRPLVLDDELMPVFKRTSRLRAFDFAKLGADFRLVLDGPLAEAFGTAARAHAMLRPFAWNLRQRVQGKTWRIRHGFGNVLVIRDGTFRVVEPSI